MLKDYINLKNNSWAIRACYHQFENDLLTIAAKVTKVNNIGFSHDATHTKNKNRFDQPIDIALNREFIFNEKIVLNSKILSESKNYFSFFKRIKSKFNMLINRLIKASQQNINFKGRIVVCSYLIVRYFKTRTDNIFFKIIFFPIIIIYKFITDFLLKCEIPASTIIGEGLILHHVMGLVLNKNVIIGRNVTLKHNTTIGNKETLDGKDLGSPIIGDNVLIGPHSIILGPIIIGNNVIIGAGSVVVKDIPPFSIVAGNPAKLIKSLQVI